MAVDKLVDSTQLDSDLTSVANAIRAKSGGSSSLAFPAGFVSEIQAIPSGGGGDTLAKALARTVTEIDDSSVTALGDYALYNCTQLTSLTLPELITLTGSYQVRNCTSLTKCVVPKLDPPGNKNMLQGCTALTVMALPAATAANGAALNIPNLEVFDLGPNCANIYNNVFNNRANFGTIIIRRSSAICALSNVAAFNGTKFASGGAGGTIYIPKALYDHLGDGSALDYKAATNWSTLDGYGATTWAKIEGTQYENYYADGTAV